MRNCTTNWLWAISYLVVLCNCGDAHGQATYAWTTGNSNSWGGTTWTRTSTGGGTGIPGAADTATINANPVTNPYTISVIDARAVNILNLSKAELILDVNAGGSLAIGGDLNFNGGILRTTGTLTVAGATIAKGFAVFDNSGGGLTLNGALTLEGAKISAGTVTANNGGAVTNGAVIDGGTTALNFASGSWAWSAGYIQVRNSSAFNIGANATVTATGGVGFSSPTGQTGTVNNAGVLQITNGNDSRVDTGATLNNTGTFRVTGSGGSWNLQGGIVNNTGVIDIGAGASVSVNGGTLNLNSGTTVTGGGRIEMQNASGTLGVNGNIAVGELLISRGTVSGSGTLTVSGAFDFGSFDGKSLNGVTINATGGGNWVNSGGLRFGTGTVNVTGGTVTWGTGTFIFTDNGALNVGAGGTFHTTGDGDITASVGKTPTISVSGTYAKTAGNGDALITAPIGFSVNAGGLVDSRIGSITFQQSGITNNGTIKASTGSLVFNAATTFSGNGTLATDAGGTLTVAPGTSNTVTQSGGTFTNDGTLNLNSGTLRIASGVVMSNYNASTTTLAGGVWNVSNATLDLDGRTVSNIAAGTTVTLSGSGNVTGLSSLNQLTGHLRILGGATLIPLATVDNGGTVEVIGTFGGAMNVTNTGILTGSGTVNGTVTVQSGGEISPGPGPLNLSGVKVLTTGNLNLNGGSRYTWEINSWTGTGAGSAFDQLRGINGVKLNLAGASASNPVILKLNSLNGSVLGQIANFDNTARSWVIADFTNGNPTNGILNFSADKFVFDTSDFANDLNGGTFSVALNANQNQLILSFTPVPEPATVLLVGVGGLAAVHLRRRTRERARVKTLAP